MLALVIPNDSNLDVVKNIKHAKVFIVVGKVYFNVECIDVHLGLYSFQILSFSIYNKKNPPISQRIFYYKDV